MRLVSFIPLWIVGALAACHCQSVQADGWELLEAIDNPQNTVLPVMTYDLGRGVTVLYTSVNGSDAQTWELGGANWILRAVGGVPELRWAALACDSKRGVIVLFGGDDGFGEVGSTWEWNGSAWNYAGQGQDRESHAMAYDSDRGVCVVFGGCIFECEEMLDNTWEFDGEEWLHRAAGYPPARIWHAMSYDTTNHRTLMHGGSPLHYDLWSWNGQVWTLLDDGLGQSGPRDRAAHSLVFDTRRGVALLFGGSSQGELRNDLWEWDGSEWTKLDTPQAPQPRRFHAMVYDPDRHRVVLFGGEDDQGNSLNDTWVYSLPLPPCYPDLDGSGTLDLFDFLTFINLFNTNDPKADCDNSGGLDLFDFLCFTNSFNAGC